MTVNEIIEELQRLGTESVRKVLRNHGAREPLFGVKIGELKKIQRRIKTDYQLALDLYDTGIYDAMYLAGPIADDARMTKKDLTRWVEKAQGGSLESATVPWVAAGSRHGRELALEWIESQQETWPWPAGRRSPVWCPSKTTANSKCPNSSGCCSACGSRSISSLILSATR